jgi:hypothetical protein
MPNFLRNVLFNTKTAKFKVLFYVNVGLLVLWGEIIFRINLQTFGFIWYSIYDIIR